MSGNGWLDEGVAKRTMWGHPNPVVHLVVVEQGEQLWCSGGPGRIAAVGSHEGTGGGRPCPRCGVLAREAVAEEMLAPSDFPRFTPKTSQGERS